MLASIVLLGSIVCQESAPASRPDPASRPAETRPAKLQLGPATPAELIPAAIERLLECQDNGAWPYEGVYRDASRQIPTGYRVGGTALACTALLYAAPPDDKKVGEAIERGVAYILKTLEDPSLAMSVAENYDVRIWGHACALEIFSHLKAKKRLGAHAKEIEKWIPELVKIITEEEIEGGGWNYATHKTPASFVTVPVVQSLLFAKEQGAAVPKDLVDRAAEALRIQRLETGAFVYDSRDPSIAKPNPNAKKANAQVSPTSTVPGACARSAACEAMLSILGRGDPKNLKGSIDAFFENWDELEKRRKKTGTHEGPYRIAPYYFYYGHRYAAQAIELLPKEARAKERERMLETLLRTRDDDGTWNDRQFPRSRAYGTSMAILVLLQDRQPIPQSQPLNLKR